MKEPFATMIVRGEKTWEIRKTKTKIRGKIYIISNGYIIGTVKLIDVLGPFSVEELAKYYEKHRVDKRFLKEYSKNKKLYAWVLSEAKELKRKIKVSIPRGAQIWVRNL